MLTTSESLAYFSRQMFLRCVKSRAMAASLFSHSDVFLYKFSQTEYKGNFCSHRLWTIVAKHMGFVFFFSILNTHDEWPVIDTERITSEMLLFDAISDVSKTSLSCSTFKLYTPSMARSYWY